MVSRAHSVMIPLVVSLLAIAAALALFSMLPRKWFNAPPEPLKPLPVELIEPEGIAPAQPTRGMMVGSDGFGTILSAPGRRSGPSPSQAAHPPRLRVEPPVAARVARLIRLLARLSPVPPSNQLIVVSFEEPPPYFSTIILRGGCLKLAEPGEPHAILPSGARLYVDDEGFLTAGVFANGTASNPRLGELAWWSRGKRTPVDAASIAQIRAKCGPGAIRLIGPAQSVSASKGAADEIAARNLMNRYGLPWATALAKTRACRDRLATNSGIDPAKMIYNPCGSTPPFPVANPGSCPAGTNFAGGLCRTADGHIRPVPAF